jgi:hypothetical protein
MPIQKHCMTSKRRKLELEVAICTFLKGAAIVPLAQLDLLFHWQRHPVERSDACFHTPDGGTPPFSPLPRGRGQGEGEPAHLPHMNKSPPFNAKPFLGGTIPWHLNYKGYFLFAIRELNTAVWRSRLCTNQYSRLPEKILFYMNYWYWWMCCESAMLEKEL